MRMFKFFVKNRFVKVFRLVAHMVDSNGKRTSQWIKVEAPAQRTNGADYPGVYAISDPGFRASVRDLTASERVAGGEQTSQGGIAVVTGLIPGVRGGDWLTFEGEDYQITTVDRLNYAGGEIKLTAVRRVCPRATEVVRRRLDYDSDRGADAVLR